jgi:hypothetical protein
MNRKAMNHVIEWCNSVLLVGKPANMANGICSNLQVYMEGACCVEFSMHDVLILCETFPEYSGDMLYPLDWSGVMYKDRNLPKWSGEYGEKRLRLVEHIRDEVLKELFQ